MIDKLVQTCPDHIDLTNKAHLELIESIVDELLVLYPKMDELEAREQLLTDQNDQGLIFVLLAFKLAKSRLIIEAIDKPIKLSVVFAVYKEHNRIRTKEEHPHGEDFLRWKVHQLEWLFANKPNFDWELLLVDDGCPEKSGEIAREIIKKYGLENNVKVYFLKDAIEQKLKITNKINTTNQSQKGGSIIYGIWEALQQNTDKEHIIVYTDADLSTHLGQTALLIDTIINGNKSVAIGSRREKQSVVIKKGSRNDRGKLFIYLWKRLIPNLSEIIDTQCGFKAFRKEMASRIIDDMVEYKFAFDIELLLRAALKDYGQAQKVAIAWIDSEAASTTTDLQPYLAMLKAIVKMYRKYFPASTRSDAFASFIDLLDDDAFQLLLANIPHEITKREADELNAFEGVSAADLHNCISANR